jgi:hypothetical protein
MLEYIFSLRICIFIVFIFTYYFGYKSSNNLVVLTYEDIGLNRAALCRRLKKSFIRWLENIHSTFSWESKKTKNPFPKLIFFVVVNTKKFYWWIENITVYILESQKTTENPFQEKWCILSRQCRGSFFRMIREHYRIISRKSKSKKSIPKKYSFGAVGASKIFLMIKVWEQKIL